MMLDDAGAFAVSASCDPALAGAVLAELALAGAIEIETEGGLWKRTRVAVDNPAAVTDPVLTEALEDIATKKRSPQDLVTRLGKQVPEKLCNRLVERGLVRREESKVLGLMPRTRWPATDSSHEQELRALRRPGRGGGTRRAHRHRHRDPGCG